MVEEPAEEPPAEVDGRKSELFSCCWAALRGCGGSEEALASGGRSGAYFEVGVVVEELLLLLLLLLLRLLLMFLVLLLFRTITGRALLVTG